MTDLTDEAVKTLLDGATPGPWTMESETLFGKDFGYTVDLFDVVPYDTNERFEADARLIAAAPDLARALIASEAARKLAEERLAKALVAREKIKAAYEELLATVHGECPSLINEDSGGSQVLLDLILAADEAITTIKELNE